MQCCQSGYAIVSDSCKLADIYEHLWHINPAQGLRVMSWGIGTAMQAAGCKKLTDGARPPAQWLMHTSLSSGLACAAALKHLLPIRGHLLRLSLRSLSMDDNATLMPSSVTCGHSSKTRHSKFLSPVARLPPVRSPHPSGFCGFDIDRIPSPGYTKRMPGGSVHITGNSYPVKQWRSCR